MKNVVERAVCRAENGVVPEVVFDPFAARAAAAAVGPAAQAAAAAVKEEADPALPVKLPELIAALERRYLQQALTQARFRQREAATLLGLSYDQFRGLYRKYQSVFEPAANGTNGGSKEN